MSDCNIARQRILLLLDDIMATNKLLWAKGIDCGGRQDKQDALAILSRITQRAYGGDA